MVAERSPSLTVFPMTDGSLPNAVVQKRYVSTAAPAACGPSSVASEQAAQHRTESHDLEVRAADDPGADHARLAEADHREVDRGEVAEGRQRLDAPAQVLDLRDGEIGVLGADAARALADVDQAVFVAVDERPQEHAPDDAEDRGVGANAERQGDDHRDGQSLDPGQRPQRKPEIGDEAHTQRLVPPARKNARRGAPSDAATPAWIRVDLTTTGASVRLADVGQPHPIVAAAREVHELGGVSRRVERARREFLPCRRCLI